MEAHFGGAIPVEFELITRGLESELNQACLPVILVAGGRKAGEHRDLEGYS